MLSLEERKVSDFSSRKIIIFFPDLIDIIVLFLFDFTHLVNRQGELLLGISLHCLFAGRSSVN